MRNNNTQGKTEFITEHIFWLALAWIWYRSLLFRCVPQHTLTESKLILLGFVLVFSAVGILFQMQNNRNGMGVFLDLVLGYGANTVLTYWPIYPRLIKICLVAAGILSLLYAALVLCRRMRSRKYALKILCKRLGLVAFMSKKIVGMYGSRGTLVPVIALLVLMVAAIVAGIVSCFTQKEGKAK